MRTDPGFREIGLGVWEDLTWGEINRDYAREYQRFVHRLWDFRIRNGETIEQVGRRYMRALRRVTDVNTGAVAIVSHGMALRRAVANVMGLNPREKNPLKMIDNTAVTEITFSPDAEPNVVCYADNSHLGALSTLARQKWWRDGQKDYELCFDPVALPRERAMVEAFRREAWEAVYGSLDEYQSNAKMADAERCRKRHRKALVIARLQGRPVGLMQLDPDFKSDEGLGHIALIVLSDEYRGMGLGAQFIGHAVGFYRALGRHSLHLRVAEDNEPAIRFYKKLGFEHTATEESRLRPLLIMRKSLLPPLWVG